MWSWIRITNRNSQVPPMKIAKSNFGPTWSFLFNMIFLKFYYCSDGQIRPQCLFIHIVEKFLNFKSFHEKLFEKPTEVIFDYENIKNQTGYGMADLMSRLKEFASLRCEQTNLITCDSFNTKIPRPLSTLSARVGNENYRDRINSIFGFHFQLCS